ncbi:MAG: CoA transferase, partial [Acidobacteriota bacterium]
LAALEPKFWKRFCEAVGRKDLVSKQLQDVQDDIAQIIAGRPRAAWEGFFAEHDIPGEPVLAASEALAHPQVAHRDLLRAADDGILRLGFPATFDGERPRASAHVPELGGDTEAITEEHHLAPHLSPKQRRGAGIGRKGGLKRWLVQKAAELAERARSRRA